MPEVQEWFDQGNTLLHSFWYYEAERSFRWCLKLDPEYHAALPGLRVRLFLDVRSDDGLAFQEVPLNLDTLWVDMDDETLVLVWRGTIDVRDQRLEDFENVLVAREQLSDGPADIESMKTLRDRLIAEEQPEAVEAMSK